MERSTPKSSGAAADRAARIYELQSGSAAVLEPGYLEAFPGATIWYQNETNDTAQLVVAQGGLFVGVQPMVPEDIAARQGRTFTVDRAAAPGSHEYQVVVTLGSGKRVFAIGASTPRIIIRSSSSVD